MDARALEQAKRRWAKQLWKQLDANPNLTDAERRSVMLTGHVSEAARQSADEDWQKRGAENRGREHERQQRADLERLLLGRARRAGFQLVHADTGLRWDRIRPQNIARQRGASRERRPQTRRRVARTSGSRGDPPPGESDPESLAPWRGLEVASIRMSAHVLRRIAAARAA
jgi:hypothetical protein